MTIPATSSPPLAGALAPQGQLHPVANKLRQQVLPYTESAKLLNRQWFYRAHQLFGYATDITIALGAIGIGLPLLTALTQQPKEGQPTPDVVGLVPTDPAWLYWIALLSVIVWVVLRVAFNREEGQKRAVLAKSCRLTLRQAEASLHTVLAQPDPMPELIKMVQEQIKPAVDRNIQEGSWPWTGPADDAYEPASRRLAFFQEQYASEWTPVDATGRKEGM